jgi:hypothetical protein
MEHKHEQPAWQQQAGEQHQCLAEFGARSVDRRQPGSVERQHVAPQSRQESQENAPDPAQGGWPSGVGANDNADAEHEREGQSADQGVHTVPQSMVYVSRTLKG